MKLRYRSTRLLAVLCLILFQSQLVAGGWMPCKHGSPVRSDVVCPLHAQQQVQSDVPHPHAAHPFDCAKCTLAVVIGSLQSLQPLVTVRIQSGTPYRYASRGCFYYQFFPDRAAKPPRTLVV